MKSNKTTFAIIIGAILIAVVVGVFLQQNENNPQTSDESAIRSPYVGEETRGIKALAQDDIEGLLTGAGTPFGGMAKPAELNGYPGPRHVLDAIEAEEFEVTDEQKVQIEKLYEEMKTRAIELGKLIIDLEKEIDDAFTDETITETFLQNKVSESANLYGQLRIVHLKYHLQMVDILTPEQVEQYNLLRGYIGDNDPCEKVPEGHDVELWKLHNNCE